MVKPHVICILRAEAETAESPVWCPRQEVLYWVDVGRKQVHRFSPQTGIDETWTVPETVGSLGLRADGGLVLALRSGFCLFDQGTGTIDRLADANPGAPWLTLADGRCDPRGRFWAGSQVVEDGPPGKVYRLDPDRSCHPFWADIHWYNGTAWSPDGRSMYFADSFTGVIFVADYDVDGGLPTGRRIFATVSAERGMPDGSIVDEHGYLWNANWGGGCITRYAPDGSIDRIVELPVKTPTSCTFGGPGLGTLYVTTQRKRMTAQDLLKWPDAGGLFAVNAGVRGLPENRFAG